MSAACCGLRPELPPSLYAMAQVPMDVILLIESKVSFVKALGKDRLLYQVQLG